MLWGKQNLVPPFHPAPVDLFHNADGSLSAVASFEEGVFVAELAKSSDLRGDRKSLRLPLQASALVSDGGALFSSLKCPGFWQNGTKLLFCHSCQFDLGVMDQLVYPVADRLWVS